jgi:HEAT repeat protein
MMYGVPTGAVLALALAVGEVHAQSRPGPLPSPSVGDTTPKTAAPRVDRATTRLASRLVAEFQRKGSFEVTTLEQPGALAALAYVALTATDALLLQATYEAIHRLLDELATAGKDPRKAPALVGQAILAGLGRGERPVLAQALRAAAAMNLGPEVHPQVLRAMADLALRHPDADVRYAALEALTQIGLRAFVATEVVPDVILKALDDPNEAVAGFALSMLRLLPSRWIVEPEHRARVALARLRHHGRPAVRAMAIGASVKLYDPPVLGDPLPVEPSPERQAFVAELVRTLDDPAPVVRAMASAALGLFHHKAAVPRLAALLDDRNEISDAIGGVRSLAADEPITLPVRVVDMDEPQTVAMAALRALMVVSLSVESSRERWLECDNPSRDFATCAKRAREWARRLR